MMNDLRENGHSMWSEEPEPEEQRGGSRSCQSKGPEKEARVTSKEDKEGRQDGQEAKPPFFGWSTMASGEARLLVLGARTECVSLEPSNQSNSPDRTLSLELVILKK